MTLPTMTQQEERRWAMCAHLGALAGHIMPLGHVVVPFVVWTVKREESAFVDTHGREALNAQISATLYAIVLGLVGLVRVGTALLLFCALGLWALDVGLVIWAARTARAGRVFRYPGILRPVKK